MIIDANPAKAIEVFRIPRHVINVVVFYNNYIVPCGRCRIYCFSSFLDPFLNHCLTAVEGFVFPNDPGSLGLLCTW